MNLMEKVRKGLNNPLSTFVAFEIIIAFVCIGIPVVLRLADSCDECNCCCTYYNAFRSSISDYAYMQHNYYFGMLLCMASMLFIYNGAVYFNNEDQFDLSKHGKWYNVVLGVSLLMVIIFPYKEFSIPHYVFSGIFFFGNAIVTIVFHDKKNRWLSIVLALLTLASFVFFLFKTISLFWAEWASLTIIGVHFILEARTAVIKVKLERKRIMMQQMPKTQ